MSNTIDKVNTVKFSDDYKLDDWIWGKKLGEGAFGSVKSCAFGINKSIKVAIKIMKKKSRKLNEQIENERDILNQIEHPFIMEYYGQMEDNSSVYFITELIKGGDLFTHHRLLGNFNKMETAFYGAQIISIFEYLHEINIVYRDLKPENIMINADGYLKLIDFGFAKHIRTRTYTICGTPEYIAPEILLNEGHGKEVDWWTLGILLYEMVVGYPPFQDDDPMDLYCKILNSKPRYPHGFDSRLKSLTKHMLRRDLGKRISDAQRIKNHRFFDDIDFDELVQKQLNPPYLPQQTEEPPIKIDIKKKPNCTNYDLKYEKQQFLKKFENF